MLFKPVNTTVPTPSKREQKNDVKWTVLNLINILFPFSCWNWGRAGRYPHGSWLLLSELVFCLWVFHLFAFKQ